MTSEITSPSRRTIAKGAAWAVPAVAVASAAPSLAASPTACEPGALEIGVECPSLISGGPSLYFTVTNPADSDCTVPAGTPITVDRSGLAGVDVGPLNDINVGADVLFSDATNATTQRDLAPGDSIEVHIFPPGLANVSVLQNATVSIDGASLSQGYTIISLLGLNIAVCGLG